MDKVRKLTRKKASARVLSVKEPRCAVAQTFFANKLEPPTWADGKRLWLLGKLHRLLRIDSFVFRNCNPIHEARKMGMKRAKVIVEWS